MYSTERQFFQEKSVLPNNEWCPSRFSEEPIQTPVRAVNLLLSGHCEIPSATAAAYFADTMPIMQNGAFVVVQESWPGLYFLYRFLREGEYKIQNGQASLMGIAETNQNGITLKGLRSDTPKFKFSQARVFVPWRYVDGILWHDDIGGVEQQLGFASAHK